MFDPFVVTFMSLMASAASFCVLNPFVGMAFSVATVCLCGSLAGAMMNGLVCGFSQQNRNCRSETVQGALLWPFLLLSTRTRT
jgi:hypothetical protein